MPKPPLQGEVALRSNDGEVVQRKSYPSYNLSVSLTLDSSPSRGALGSAENFISSPEPPLQGEVAMRSIDGEVVWRIC